MRARALRRQRGLALLVVLVTMLVVGVIAAALFAVALAESRAARSAPDRARALWSAEFGLAVGPSRDSWNPLWNATPRRGLLFVRALSPGDDSLDSLSVWKLAPADFLLVSSAVSGPPEARARRRLGTLLTLRAPLVSPRAPALVLDSVRVEPGGSLSGADSSLAGWECDSAGPPLPNVLAGEAGPERFGAVARTELAAGARQLPFDAVLSPAPRLDAAGACDRSDAANLGDPLHALGPDSPCADHLPLLHAPGALHLAGGAGQGMLVVDGDLLLDSGARYMGLLLVRGEVRVAGGASVLGAVIASRLVVENDARVRLSRCAAERAALAAGRPLPARGGWVELP